MAHTRPDLGNYGSYGSYKASVTIVLRQLTWATIVLRDPSAPLEAPGAFTVLLKARRLLVPGGK
jgi:hypothetical protein